MTRAPDSIDAGRRDVVALAYGALIALAVVLFRLLEVTLLQDAEQLVLWLIEVPVLLLVAMAAASWITRWGRLNTSIEWWTVGVVGVGLAIIVELVFGLALRGPPVSEQLNARGGAGWAVYLLVITMAAAAPACLAATRQRNHRS